MTDDETREEAVERCGCEQSIALTAEVERLRESMMAVLKALEAGPDYALWRGACEHAENIARSALSPKVPE